MWIFFFGVVPRVNPCQGRQCVNSMSSVTKCFRSGVHSLPSYEHRTQDVTENQTKLCFFFLCVMQFFLGWKKKVWSGLKSLLCRCPPVTAFVISGQSKLIVFWFCWARWRTSLLTLQSHCWRGVWMSKTPCLFSAASNRSKMEDGIFLKRQITDWLQGWPWV